jgi:tetratricopeptide (TPR) repeat protein
MWSTCPRCKVVFQVPEGAPAPALCPGCSVQPVTVAEPGWFYARNRQKVGPVSREQLQQLAASGQLKPDDMVLQEGSRNWVPARSVPGVFVATAETVEDIGRTASAAPALSVPSAGSASRRAGAPPAVAGYEILSELGRGGMGVVYKARHLQLKRVVALKMILGSAHAGAAEVARFKTEAEAVARLQHVNIVQIYEVGDQDGQPYFSLEFVEGGPLSRRLDGSPLPPREAAQLVATMAAAMHAAHARGIVHRDLKPHNILLSASPPTPIGQTVPKIADFGLAKTLDSDSAQTATGAIMGTPSYMAPEQAEGRVKDIGPLSDVYALGAILYELLTGRPPFRGATVLETLEQVRTREPVAPRDLQPGVPVDLQTICLKCLEKQSARRYASAQELADDLGRFLRDEPIHARPAGMGERLLKFTRRNKLLVGSTAAVILALLIGLITAIVSARQASQARKETEATARKALADAAKFHFSQGDYQQALETAEKAIKLGYPDPVEMRLLQVRALIGKQDSKGAERLVAEIRQGGNLGRHEGAVLLLEGNSLFSEDEGSGLRLIQQALEKELLEADRAYALGMLADTSEEALKHFRAALNKDPHHQDARRMLGILLLLLGRLDEAWEVATEGAGRYPADPTFKFFRAMIRSLRGDDKGARAELDRMAPTVGAKDIEALKHFTNAMAMLYTWDGVFDPDGERFLARVGAEATPFITHFYAGALLGQGQAEKAMQDFIRTPPTFSRSLSRLYPVLRSFVFGGGGVDAERLLPELEEVLRGHPEGLLVYFKAALLFNKERYAEAETVFLKAASTPSFVNIRRMGLLAAIRCEKPLLRDPEVGPEMRQRAVKNIRELRQIGKQKPVQLEVLIGVAINCEAYDLARGLLDDWEAQSGQVPDVLRKRAHVELVAGNPVIALDAARKLLQQLPDDPGGKAIRAEATAHLRKLVRTLP